jgi:hypothetical protein
MKVTCEEFKKLTVSSRMVNRILKILNTSTSTMIKQAKSKNVQNPTLFGGSFNWKLPTDKETMHKF